MQKPISREDFVKLDYPRWCANETARFTSPITTTALWTTTKFQLTPRYFAPEKTVIIPSPYGACHFPAMPPRERNETPAPETLDNSLKLGKAPSPLSSPTNKEESFASSAPIFNNPDAFDPGRMGPGRQEHVTCAHQCLAYGAGAHECPAQRWSEQLLAIFFIFASQYSWSNRPKLTATTTAAAREENQQSVQQPAPQSTDTTPVDSDAEGAANTTSQIGNATPKPIPPTQDIAAAATPSDIHRGVLATPPPECLVMQGMETTAGRTMVRRRLLASVSPGVSATKPRNEENALEMLDEDSADVVGDEPRVLFEDTPARIATPPPPIVEKEESPAKDTSNQGETNEDQSSVEDETTDAERQGEDADAEGGSD